MPLRTRAASKRDTLSRRTDKRPRIALDTIAAPATTALIPSSGSSCVPVVMQRKRHAR